MYVRCGLLLLTILSAVVTGLLVTAVVSPSWFNVRCGDGSQVGKSLQVGLWSVCESLDPGGKDADYRCHKMDTKLLQGRMPGWLSGGRLLASCGAAAAGVTSLLLLGYCFVPPATVLDSAHGLGFAGIGTATFCFVNILNAYVGRVDLGGLLSPSICHQPNTTYHFPKNVGFSRGFHFTLAGAFVSLLGGLCGVAARMVAGPSMLSDGGGEGDTEGTGQGQGRKKLFKRHISRKVLTKIRMRRGKERKDT